MNWFLDLEIRHKLLLGFGLVVACLVAVAGTAFVTISELQTSRRLLLERDVVLLEELITLRTNESLQRMRMLEMQVARGADERDAIERELRAQAALIEASLQNLTEIARQDPDFRTRLQSLRQLFTDYRRTQLEQVNLVKEGRAEEAAALAAGPQRDRFERIRATSLELDRLAREQTREDTADAERRAEWTLSMFVLTGLGAFLAAAALGFLLNRVIAGPLKELAKRSERIALGDAAVVSIIPRSDEIGELEQKFNLMAQSLRDKALVAERIAGGDLAVQVVPRSDHDTLGKAFAAMVGSLRTILGEIDQGITVLGATGREIMSATSTVAVSSAETASAISETSSTIEEIKQTAQVAASRARQVSEGAQRTLESSVGGKRSVDELVEAMNGIQEQMGAIAESMIRLAEQSHTISGIIATVGDLAEQSNILAVNAAIEAAKAGEQGKGFAVVAQEVRSLAEQSRQATTRVRKILGDTQKATEVAVSATEQASRAVESGVTLSRDAGDAIRALTASIIEAAGAASQIAVSAQQQLVGMDQAVLAIQNIREASARNVDSTRQAESASQRLERLGASLREVVKSYRL